jgi:rhodanese-related sulfurtransferase
MKQMLIGLSFLLASASVAADVVAIGNAQLARLARAGVPVIDIRTAGEWQETGVVPGSRLVTLFDANGRADASAWLKAVRAVAKPDEPVIVICRSGNRTVTASRLLAEEGGYRTVYNVKDGIRGWAGEGYALMPVTAAIAACPAGTPC